MDPEMRDNSSSVEETSNEKRGLYGDVLGKWRSCEQVDNGTPSTSPSYEDSENDDGTKPSALYNKFTWKIEKFSTIDTRELRSPAYDAGGYKWYILIYPQGCDVSNHLSLFLCVANHDKFLPGWSHFAQFTIAVVNKDINKSKYSDTLHRFWKKEHDWGWKKFMELSKLSDGFIIDDTLVIDAQVQVIRENAHRPFRCLDHEYRRELVRVYSSNVEQICRRFFEDRRGRLSKLIEDKLRWSSFRVFWLGINQNVRQRMSRDTTEAILKLVVKHFFIEKEVTSTLVMDSLYYGLRALEGQSLQTKDGKSGGEGKPAVVVKSQVPMVCIEKDMFVLAADVLLLLERAALAPHQPLLLKDEKASHNRTKDGSSGEEFYKDIIERDERRFTELGLRTLELFILIHIFSRIEVAYNEVVALKRQEELIREEEAAGQLENELRAKRLASEKEKRTKKKQAKQKRNARKGKDRGKDEKPETAIQKHHTSGPSNGKNLDHEKSVAGKIETETQEDASDDGSDAGDDAPESLKPEIEVHLAVSHEIQNGVEREKRITSPAIDDSCSTCSTGSASSVVIVMNGAQKGISSPSDKRRTSRIRAKDHTREQICSTHGGNNPSSDSASAENSLVSQAEPAAAVVSKDQIQHPAEKEEKEVETIIRDRFQEKLLSKSRISPPSPAKKPPSAPQQSKKSSETTTTTFAITHEPVSRTPAQNEKSAPLASKSPPPTTKTSYVQEEKEVETIIRDRLQEEFLSKSRISPTSPAKKPPSAPQQPKNSSETTTTTFATTHVPVSGTSAQNEKSAPQGTKSPSPTTATTTTKTSYVLEEKEVETIIRDRLQEDLLSKSRISPPSPAKKLPSAPQQPKKSSETTTTTFATTHEPVSSTPAQNEKSSPLGTKSLPPTTATTTTKTEAKKLTTTSLPRPLSAPLVDSPRPTASIVSTVQTSPLLSRSVSSAAQLGTDLPTAAPSSLPQSARNPVSSTTSGSGPLACSTSSTEPTSYSQSPSKVQNSLPNSRHGLGPTLPESLSGLRDGLSVQLATAGEVSDEFPHLDIINDLLDEDQTAGVKSQFHPYFGRQYTFPRDAATTSDIGSSGEGFRGPHGYSGGGPLNGPRDSQTAQMEPSVYAGGRIDGARRSRWPYRASVLNLGSEDDDGNLYQTRDYGNGYNMF